MPQLPWVSQATMASQIESPLRLLGDGALEHGPFEHRPFEHRRVHLLLRSRSLHRRARPGEGRVEGHRRLARRTRRFLVGGVDGQCAHAGADRDPHERGQRHDGGREPASPNA
jgi:hypothetical protein